MVKRTDNMLEAFQASTLEDLPTSAPSPGVHEAGRAVRSARSRASSGGSELILPMGGSLFIVLQVGVLLTVFLIGFRAGMVRQVQAGGPTEGGLESAERSDQARAAAGLGAGAEFLEGGADRVNAGASSAAPTLLSARGEGSAAASRSAAERAFEDPSNRFTVLVFTADDSEFGRGMARKNHEHLQAMGLPAIEPRRKGRRLVLYVGAYPTRELAANAQDRIRGVVGPDGGRAPFRDAYIVNIDK